MNRLYALAVISLLFIVSCNNPSSSNGDAVVATESWHISDDGTDNYADIELKKSENGTTTCTGNWYYDFFGYTVTCAIMNGTVEKDGNSYTFNCTGTAAYPPDGDGYVESSDFSLQMTGQLAGGSGSGGWAISFADEEWDGWAPEPGSFTATLQSGSGVTE